MHYSNHLDQLLMANPTRKHETPLQAIRMIVRGEGSWLWRKRDSQDANRVK
jgi:adenosylmethionine-8-amino-7-oxononanoate aminotransferase